MDQWPEAILVDDGQNALQPTARTKLRRFPVRGSFDKTTVYAILDKAPIVHIGFNKDGAPAMDVRFPNTSNSIATC